MEVLDANRQVDLADPLLGRIPSLAHLLFILLLLDPAVKFCGVVKTSLFSRCKLGRKGPIIFRPA